MTRSGVVFGHTRRPHRRVFLPFYDFNPLTQAIAVNADGTVTAAAGTVPGVGQHPAKADDTIFFYASGLGALDKAPPPDGVNSIDTLEKDPRMN